MYVNKQHTNTHTHTNPKCFQRKLFHYFSGKVTKQKKNYCCGKKNYYIIIIK